MGLVVLKVTSAKLGGRSNCMQKIFSRMRHGGLVVGSIIVEFLPEFHQMEEHCFGFIINIINEESNGLNDVIDDSF